MRVVAVVAASVAELRSADPHARGLPRQAGRVRCLAERHRKVRQAVDALIRLGEVTKRYAAGGALALDRVSLQVAAGEAVA